MFEKFKSGTALETFKQRYEGTYGFYKDESGKRMLVQITSVSNTQCDFADAKGVTFHMNPDSPREIGFEFLPPKSMWYNTVEGAVFCQRLAMKQFQRGITGKSLEISVAKKGELLPVKINFPILSNIYEKAVSPKDALPVLLKDKSLAISSQFALDQGVVYLFKEIIGKYEYDAKKDFMFKLNEPDLWRTEIGDAVTAMGCTSTIR